MKIGEILELTKTKSLAEIAKEHLSVGKEKARDALKRAGCYSKNGVKGWFCDDQNVLEQSIYDFVELSKINRKPRPNLRTNERNDKKNQRSNVHEKRAKDEIELTIEQTNVIRKRSSFDIDVELMKDLKIQAIVHDRTVYEIVETAVRQYLEKMKN
ncbi:hypothetical protein ACIQD3_24220 [Peribacillus loiseleuriae]|uniref:hypothetical protein n=1 Tax=Peribacillus loiseleuriae TaxID=1679170 RepID=UPI00381D5D59